MENKIIFVLGSGKCGTTSFTHLLNCSDDIDARHEAYPTLWEYSKVVYEDAGQFIHEKLYWNARESIIYQIENEGKVFADVNHRSTVFLPSWKKMFPNAVYIVLWRDFDETVVSLARWGCYGEKDVGIIYRPQPDTELEYRKACAWYWVSIYEYILEYLPENVIGFPLEWMKDHETEKIQSVFDKLDVGIPAIPVIEQSISQRYNTAKTDKEIIKNWHEFDERASRITKELQGLSGW